MRISGSFAGLRHSLELPIGLMSSLDLLVPCSGFCRAAAKSDNGSKPK